MIALILILSLVALVCGGIFFWIKGNNLSEDNPNNSDNEDNYHIFAILFWVAAFFFLLIICCLYNRIKLASRMIAATADFITDES